MFPIEEMVREAKRKKIKQFPVNSNRASDLGHACVKYHVLNRTKWQEKALHSVELQTIFDLGNEFEKIIIRDLEEAEIAVVEQQRAFQWQEYQITGHIDGKLLNSGKVYPFDAKSCSPYVFDSISDINSLKKGKYPYLRKYPTQLNLYMLMDNTDEGVLVFKNKVTGALKGVWMQLDYDLGEETLKRAESINKHLAEKTLPEGINNAFWCDDCPYKHICLPEQKGIEFEVVEGELGDMLDRMEVLKPFISEHKELDELIKKMTEGRPKILAGDWVITGSWYERKSYDIPSSIKEKYVTATKYWRRKITRVGGEE